MTKVTYTEIANSLRETSKVCMEIKGSYSYATGAYESIISGIVADLPSHKQAEVMRTLRMLREDLCK
jgi:hypothetical protein